MILPFGTIVMIIVQIKVNNLTWFYTNYGELQRKCMESTEDVLEAKNVFMYINGVSELKRKGEPLSVTKR